MFDCVLPTRLARHGAALTQDGRINLKNARYRTDFGRSTPSAHAKRAQVTAGPIWLIS